MQSSRATMSNEHPPLCDQKFRWYLLLMSSLFLQRKSNKGKLTGFEQQKMEIMDDIMKAVVCNSNKNCCDCNKARKKARDAALQSWRTAREKARDAKEKARDAALQSWKDTRSAAIECYNSVLNTGLRNGSMSGRC